MKGDGGDPVVGLEGMRSLSSQSPELIITSFFLFILAHKGDIIGVDVQLEWSKHFHFHLNYENGKEKRGPLTTWRHKYEQ